MCSLECYFGVYFPRCCATGEINTIITLSWAHKQFATRVHTLFYIYAIFCHMGPWYMQYSIIWDHDICNIISYGTMIYMQHSIIWDNDICNILSCGTMIYAIFCHMGPWYVQCSIIWGHDIRKPSCNLLLQMIHCAAICQVFTLRDKLGKTFPQSFHKTVINQGK